MLITKNVEIKIMYKNINYYNKLGYNVKINDIITINTNDLPKSSHKKVIVECDICGEKKEKLYKDFITQRKKYNFDTCIKCKNIKSKKTMMNRYGVEHALQNIKFLKKAKNTTLNRYGVKNYRQSKEYEEKVKNIINEKYNVDFITQTEEFKTKAKKTKKEKYGDENFNNYNKISKTKKEKYGDKNFNNIEKIKKTNLKKYGVENVSQIENIKNKKRKTCLKNYDVVIPLKSSEILEKLKNTNIKKLGVPYPMMDQNVRDKTFETNISSGKWLNKDKRSDYYNYYLLVCKYTLKNKNKLINNWNGYDYYSNEYIFDNFNLDSNNKEYPTIDHKISIRYGFDNNILPEEISKIDNLCITTRSNNSSKGRKIDKNFNI